MPKEDTTEEVAENTADQTTEETVVEETVSTEETAVETKTEDKTDTVLESEKETESKEPESVEKKAEPEKVERLIPDADKYTLPEGVPLEVAKFAHDNDMTQAQLDETLSKFGGYLASSQEADKAQIFESGKALLNEWGDQSKANVNTINRTLAHVDPEGSLKQLLETSGYINHPTVLNHLLAVGTTLKEGGFVLGNNNTPSAGITAAQAMFPKHKSVQH